jgi:murein L,D-transpeptidase YafK
MNYPNELDKHLGKTGYGIWLHGTDPVYYSRPPLDSEGCVVLPNIDLSKISEFLKPGSTPVIVAEQVSWLELPKWNALANEVESAIYQWRDDWASGDVESYLQHYADEFWSGKHDKDSWVKRKRRIAQTKTYQQINIDNVSLYSYPKSASNGREIIVANFRQDYRSNNLSSEMNKRLYLTHENGQWRVLYEGKQ